jgi:hypothetical protein
MYIIKKNQVFCQEKNQVYIVGLIKLLISIYIYIYKSSIFNFFTSSLVASNSAFKIDK